MSRVETIVARMRQRKEPRPPKPPITPRRDGIRLCRYCSSRMPVGADAIAAHERSHQNAKDVLDAVRAVLGMGPLYAAQPGAASGMPIHEDRVFNLHPRRTATWPEEDDGGPW